MTQPLACAINDVINILSDLGLPKEIAMRIVYKFSGLVHSTAMMLRQNPRIQKVSATLQRYVYFAGTLHTAPLVCSCKLGRRYPRRDQRFALNHRVPTIFHWITLRRDPELWMTRIHGWKNDSNDKLETQAFSDSFICPYSRLLLRCILNRCEPEDNRVIDMRNTLSSAVFPDECYVLGYDLSIAAWLKRAPYEALMEYAKGVSGMSESEIYDVMATKRRKGLPSRVNSFILEH